MLELFFYFLLVLALTLTLAALVIQSPAHPGTKVLALAVAAGLLASSYLVGTALLGRPKPTRLAILERAASEAVVVASLNAEGKAIYLWLVLPGETAPRAYTLPWSQETAEALRRARVPLLSASAWARMRTPFRRSTEETDQKFYAPPPPPMPPKS